MPDQQIPDNELCDTCRQHRAIVRFVDNETGSPRDRKVCATCFLARRPSSDLEMIDINKVVLLQGKCERCGKPAFCVSGIPGPDRLVLCQECAEQKSGEQRAPP